MSDLISRAALLEEYKKLLTNYYRVPQEKIHHLITNAPAINSLQNCDTQGEPVLIVGEYMPLKMADILRAMPHGTKLYTAPPQPQTVKDALEKAAEIVRNAPNILNVASTEVVLVAIASDIDALIEKE